MPRIQLSHVDVVVFAWRADHRDTVARDLHAHFAHVGHAALAHCHITAEKCAYSFVEVAWAYPDKIRRVMPHLVHCVVGHMAVHRPVAGIVRNKFHGSGLTDRHQDCVPGLLRCLWDL